MSSAEGDDRRRSESAGLPDHDDFDQYVTQAEVDRDPFAIALFEVKPINHDSTALLNRLGQTLLQFASPTTHVAYLGRNRFGLLSHSDDTTQRWVAPVAGALRVTLDCWLTEEVSYAVARQELESKRASATPGSRLASSLSGVVADLDVDVSDLLERTTLMTGVARGLSREVWINAEQALARAYKQRIPVAEYRQTDHLVDPPIRLSDRHDDPPIRVSDRHDDRPEAALTTYPNRGEAETIDHVTMVSSNRPTDDRLVVLSRRLEPVNRPEPIWHWLRLIPGLRTRPGQLATAIQLNGLAVGERALIEIWLANQVADLFAQASTKLRLSIPLSIEACQARSFAQRIFPLLEQSRVPPSRLVVEVDRSVIARTDSAVPDSLLAPSAPSVQRFIRDAGAVNVSVALTGFNGGWSAWYDVGDLPVSYVIPSPEMISQAGQGDNGAIRSLVLLAAEADRRGIELIAPKADFGLSVHALSQIGFTYGEGPLVEAAAAIPTPVDADRSTTRF